MGGGECAQSFSHIWPLETPWTVARQDLLSMEFSRVVGKHSKWSLWGLLRLQASWVLMIISGTLIPQDRKQGWIFRIMTSNAPILTDPESDKRTEPCLLEILIKRYNMGSWKWPRQSKHRSSRTHQITELFINICCGLNCIPSKFFCWSPHSHCGCIWSKEVITVKWDHMDGALFRLTFLLAETPESSLSLHSTWGHRKKVYICKVGRQPSPGLESTGTLILCLAAGRWSLGPRKGPYWQECLCFPGGQSNDVIYVIGALSHAVPLTSGGIRD